jgi:hypothetical protein
MMIGQNAGRGAPTAHEEVLPLRIASGLLIRIAARRAALLAVVRKAEVDRESSEHPGPAPSSSGTL